MNIKLNLDGKPILPKPKCEHCGKIKDYHLAKTFHCPVGGYSRTMGYTQYSSTTTFSAKKTK